MKNLDIKIKRVRRKPVQPKAPRAAPGPSPARPWRKFTLPAAGLVVLIIVMLAILVLPEAKVKISLRSEPLTRDLEIRVDQNQEQASFTDLAIPGKMIEQELSGQKTVEATGQKNVGQKASGFAYIYNFSKTTLILKAATTVLETQGKKYFFAQDIGNLRPTARIGLEDEEIDRSSLVAPVPVVAEAAGEAYNLPPQTRLEITNEVFGSQPKILYAEVSADGLSGGTSRAIKVVAEEDIARGLSELEEELLKQLREELAEIHPEWKLLPGSFVFETLEQAAIAKAGEEKQEFAVSLKIKLRGLAYRETDVLTVIRERITRLLPQNKRLATQDKFHLKSAFSQIDLQAGQGSLATHFEAEIRPELDQEEILEKLKGKSGPEISEILLSRPEIRGVEVKFYPFWAKKAPKFSKRIYLEVF